MQGLKSIIRSVVPESWIKEIKCVLCFGWRFQCPVCGGHFRKLLPFGFYRRENAMCPKCESLERHRLLWLYLKERTSFFKQRPMKLLHIAPEPCFFKIFKKMPQLDYTSADLFLPFVDLKVDVMKMPFPDNHFDVVLCSHVMVVVDDDRQGMRELYRVLKPGGWAILQEPVMDQDATLEDPAVTDPEKRRELFGLVDYRRRFGRDYKARLEAAGFKVKVDDYVKTLDPAIIAKYCMASKEDIYYCVKA